MGQQSSRIIWGKSKNPGGNDPGPVGLYQANSYIYCSGNYAIHSTGLGRVAEDYHLYLCTATETGGMWNSEDWKLINGVKNYYLIAHRSFKKGAKVIKEDHNGDFETLKLYSCIVEKTTPNQWIDDEWEVVYQEVGIAWIPRDHKDVYYDDGRNRNKWHKLMWFVPDYYEDQKSDEEIGEFSELQTYHYGERAIHRTLIGEVYCYTYDSNVPRRSEWAAGWWSKDEGVEMYETYKTYYKGDEVIKKNIEAGYQDIQQYQSEMYFERGKYTIQLIDKEHDVHELADFHDINYIERIIAGESLYGVYKSVQTTSGEFDQNAWVLQASSIIQTRGRDHNPDQKDIKQYEYCKGYTIGELCIWTYTDDDIFGLLECIKTIPETTTGEYITDYMPPNPEYWKTVDQFVEQANTLRVFKATKAMDASINTHFIRENWAIVSQKMEPDYDLYGVIWEKYGKPGGGGGIPFGFPLAISCATRSSVNRWDSAFCNFYPFMGNSCLEIENVFTGAYYTPYLSGGIGFNTSIVFGIYTYHMGETYAKSYSYLIGLYILNVGKFKKADFYDQEEKKWFLRYYENTLLYMIKADTNLNTHAGIIYKSYFFDGNIFGKTEVFRIKDEIDRESGYNLYWFDTYWNDQSEQKDPLYLTSDNPGTQIFIKHEKMYEVFGKPEMIVAEWYINRPNDGQEDYGDMHIYKQVMCVMNWDGDIIEIPYFTRYFSTGVKWHYHHSGYSEEYYDDRYFRGYLGYYTTNQPSINRLECGEAFHSLNPNSPLSDPDILALAPLVSQLEERKLLLIFYSDYYNQHENPELDAPKNAWTIYAGAYGGRIGEESPTETSLGGHYYYYYCYSPSSQEQSSGYGSVNSHSRIRGVLYNDRYGNMFIVATKYVQVTHVAYEESQTVAAQYWTLIKITRQGQYSEIPIMTISVESMASDSALKFIARDGYNLYFRRFISGQTSTAGILSLQTGTITETTFPRYFDLPYVGNQKFRVDNIEYSKVRILLLGHTVSDRDDVPSDTYLISRFSASFLDTYWTPYMATTGGVAHTGDFCKAWGSDYDSDTYGWVIYIPQLCHNPLGIGGFAWMYGYKSGNGPYYGGPSNNGFIHM